MSQADWGTMNPATEDGVGLANHLNGHRDAVMTHHSGAARPTYAKAGTIWLKVPASGNWQLMFYNGTTDIVLFTFSGTTPLLNTLTTVIPAGVIALWNAATGVPTGWGICNGTTYNQSDGSGTITSPDLRGRFVVGVSTTYTFGETGGAGENAVAQTQADGGHTHTAASGGLHDHGGTTGNTTLTLNQIPSHRHAIPGSERAQFSNGLVSYDYHYSSDATDELNEQTQLAGGGQPHSHSIADQAAHTHVINAVGDHTHGVLQRWPTFTALIYIMKL